MVVAGPSVDPTYCPVCGTIAYHKHFGSDTPTCKGCSIFFKRCIVLKKNFKCRKNEKCLLQKEKNKHGCQACRFRLCLKAGMNFQSVNNVNNEPDSISCDSNLVQKLVQYRNYTFTSRFKALLNAYNGDKSLIGSSGFLKTAETYEKAFGAEFEVCFDYIKITGLFDSNENPRFMTELTQNFVSIWMCIEVLHKNLRYLAFNQDNKAYFTDDSFQLLNEDVMKNYYESYNCLCYTDIVAQMALKALKRVVELSQKLHKMKITDNEFAIFTYFLLIKEIKRLHPEPQQFDYLLDRLFRDLKDYYEKTYDNFEIRLNDLMQAINYIHETKLVTDELFTVISLNNLKRPKTDKNYHIMPRVKFDDLN